MTIEICRVAFAHGDVIPRRCTDAHEAIGRSVVSASQMDGLLRRIGV